MRADVLLRVLKMDDSIGSALPEHLPALLSALPAWVTTATSRLLSTPAESAAPGPSLGLSPDRREVGDEEGRS